MWAKQSILVCQRHALYWVFLFSIRLINDCVMGGKSSYTKILSTNRHLRARWLHYVFICFFIRLHEHFRPSTYNVFVKIWNIKWLAFCIVYFKTFRLIDWGFSKNQGIRLCVVQWHLVSVRTFGVMYDHTFCKTCNSPDQTLGHT